MVTDALPADVPVRLREIPNPVGIERARTLAGVEEVCLSITVGNEAARRCYLSCGFVPEYIEPRYFKQNGKYYDIEWLTLRLSGRSS